MQDVPLETKWTAYVHYDKVKDHKHDYSDQYAILCSMETVVEFWRWFNNVPSPSTLFNAQVTVHGRKISGYSLFRCGVKPEWEDPRNTSGSEFCFRQSMTAVDFDSAWKMLCLASIGEQLQDVLGVRVVFRRVGSRVVQKIEVWMGCEAVKDACLARLCATSGVPRSMTYPSRWAHFLHTARVAPA